MGQSIYGLNRYYRFAMRRDYEEEILELLTQHAKNLLRIRSLSSSPEIHEFRQYLRDQLLEGGMDLGVRLRELQGEILKRVEEPETMDPAINEYYRAVYVEISFLLSAIPNDPDTEKQFDRRSAFPASSEAA
jgi:hypothetical protein